MTGLLDCNNFFVSCERLFRPDLAKKPVAVLSSNDGCIVARSAEVKALGVPMGIPLFKAKQLVDLNEVTLFSSNFTLYRDISTRVMQTLKEEVGECEVYSVDEAFFPLKATTEAELLELRKRIMQKTGIPVSIGVSSTKTLSKVASEVGKKGDGVCLLDEELWHKQAEETSCGEIWGLGRATAQKLAELQIRTAAQFMRLERRFVRKNFGVGGERIYDELHGIRVYNFGEEGGLRKSVTSTRSFAKTTKNLTELQSAVAYHMSHVAAKLRERNLAATMLYLELRASRHGDFSHRQGGTEIVLDAPTNSTPKLTKLALQAVERVFDPEVPYKKAGVVAAGLIPSEYISESLFDDQKLETDVSDLLDAVQRRFGFQALHSGAILPNPDRSSRKLRSKAYTTTWGDIPTVSA